jgi:hypothetical protein
VFTVNHWYVEMSLTLSFFFWCVVLSIQFYTVYFLWLCNGNICTCLCVLHLFTWYGLWNLRFLQWCCWRLLPSGMWHCVVWWVVPDVLKGPSASESLGATHSVTVSHSIGCESLKSSLTVCRNFFENIMFTYGFIWLRIGIICRLFWPS